MREKSCFFTGHRQIADADEYRVQTRVRDAACDMIKNGITRFISGGAAGFDTIAAEAVLYLKEEFPDIKLVLYLPCRNHAKFLNAGDSTRIFRIMENADEVKYITDEYQSDSMRLRNQALVLGAAYGIAWYENRPGGTMQTLAMARKMNCSVVNIAKEIW